MHPRRPTLVNFRALEGRALATATSRLFQQALFEARTFEGERGSEPIADLRGRLCHEGRQSTKQQSWCYARLVSMRAAGTPDAQTPQTLCGERWRCCCGWHRPKHVGGSCSSPCNHDHHRAPREPTAGRDLHRRRPCKRRKQQPSAALLATAAADAAAMNPPAAGA